MNRVLLQVDCLLKESEAPLNGARGGWSKTACSVGTSAVQQCTKRGNWWSLGRIGQRPTWASPIEIILFFRKATSGQIEAGWIEPCARVRGLMRRAASCWLFTTFINTSCTEHPTRTKLSLVEESKSNQEDRDLLPAHSGWLQIIQSISMHWKMLQRKGLSAINSNRLTCTAPSFHSISCLYIAVLMGHANHAFCHWSLVRANWFQLYANVANDWSTNNSWMTRVDLRWTVPDQNQLDLGSSPWIQIEKALLLSCSLTSKCSNSKLFPRFPSSFTSFPIHVPSFYIFPDFKLMSLCGACQGYKAAAVSGLWAGVSSSYFWPASKSLNVSENIFSILPPCACETTIKGPENPTSQLLPIMSNKCCGGDGEGRKTKEEVEERWCWTKLCVWKMVCDKVVCERWRVWKMACQRWWVTKWCVKNGVWKMVCERWCVTKLCVKDGVWQRWCVKNGVWQRWCVKDDVWKMVCDKVVWKMLCERWCVTKWCDKVVCERWCVNDGGW